MWLTAAAPVLMLTREEGGQGQERRVKTGWAKSFCSVPNAAIQNAHAGVTVWGFLITCKYSQWYHFRHGWSCSNVKLPGIGMASEPVAAILPARHCLNPNPPLTMGQLTSWTAWLALFYIECARSHRLSYNTLFPKLHMTARPGYQGEDPRKPENGWAWHCSSDTHNYNGFWRNRTDMVWTKQREGEAISQLSFGRTMSYGGKAVQVNLLCSKDVAAIGDIQALWLSRSSPADLHAKHQRRFLWVWTGAQLPNKHMLKLSCNKQALARSKVCEMH